MSSAVLRRGIGAFDALMLVVGSMIGSGIFLVSAESGRLVGSPARLLLCWAVAGILTLIGASACAELATQMPEAGGPYVFLRRAFGPLPSFLYGWTLIFIIQSGTIAAVATACAKFVGVFYPAVSSSVLLCHIGPFHVSSVQLCGALLVLLLSAENATGLRAGTRVQNVLTLAKLGAFLLLILFCLLHGGSGDTALSSPFREIVTAPQGAALLPAFAMAMVGPLFSQSAWNNVTFAGGEVRDPQRNLRTALLWGCTLVLGLYLLANVGYLHVLSFSALIHAPEQRVAAAAAEVLLPGRGGRLMAAVIIVSTLGCANGLILSGARVVYAMAADEKLPRALAAVNRARVPGRAIFAQCAWSVLLVLSGSYSSLLRYVISAELLCYAAIALSLFALRRRDPGQERHYRALGYPVLPAAYVVALLTLVLLLLIASPVTSLIGWALVLCGIPAFVIRKRR